MSARSGLWLVRHARPLVAEGLCYGASDVEADATHTEACALTLAAELPQAAWVCVSALRRAQALAGSLSRQRADLPSPVTDPRLNEMDFGQWELQPWDRIPREAFDAWTADFHGHCFGGRESVGQRLQRVGQALEASRAVVAGGRDVVWVTHAGVIRAVQHLLQRPDETPTAASWPREAPDFGGFLAMALP